MTTPKSSLSARLKTALLALVLSFTPAVLMTTFVVSAVGSVAFADGTAGGKTVAKSDGSKTFTNVQTSVCNVAKALQGPVGIGIGFLVLVAGIVMVQVASRDALPMIARAAFGTSLLLGAGAAFSAIVVADGC